MDISDKCCFLYNLALAESFQFEPVPSTDENLVLFQIATIRYMISHT